MPGATDIASFNPAGAITQAGLGVLQTAIGLVNAGKAKKEAKELARTRPKRRISEYAGQDLDLAESELAAGGLSDDSENAYNSLNNKQFSASLGAILRGGGSVNNVADVFGGNEEGRLRLAMLNDQLRMGKIQNLVRARQQMMGEQDKSFEFNEWMPWADKAQANAGARQGAENMIWSGLGTAGAGAMNYAQGKSSANMFNNYFKTTGGGGSNTPGRMPMPGDSSYSPMGKGVSDFNFNVPKVQIPEVQPINFNPSMYEDELIFKTGGGY